MKNRSERLAEAVKHLISLRMIDGKSPTKSIANIMNRNASNIGSALRGDVRYLSRKFIRDFCASFNNIISEEWIWDGIGSMTHTVSSADPEKHISEEALMRLSKEELITIIKKLLTLHCEMTENQKTLILQNEHMIQNGQELFNDITKMIYKRV